jgi:hypothetical protein
MKNTKSKKTVKKAASARKYTKWQAATFFTVILVSVVALCLAIVNSGAKSRPAVAVTSNNDPVMRISAPPVESPKVTVDPYTTATSTPKSTKPRALTNTYASAELLASRFLAYLARKDSESIKSLRITKQEFCDYVWPDLPSSRLPNVTCDFVWDQAVLNSTSGLTEMLRDHEGKRYELISLKFAKGTEVYPSYKVHKETLLRVRDEKGEEQELRLFGSILEMDGKFKLFSFVVD